MTPREALYYICLEMGPVAQTNRNENLSHREEKLRDAIRALQNFIDYRSPQGDSFDGIEIDDFHHLSHEEQMKLDLGDTE